jgi:hypothetical protein
MSSSIIRLGLVATCAGLLLAASARAADLVPYRVVYALTLSTVKPSKSVVAAAGKMTIDTGETCDGWTTEQHYMLAVQNADDENIAMTSNFTSWEAKDGLRFHFFDRDTKNGSVTQEVSGEAELTGPRQGGKAAFTRPAEKSLTLDPGAVFPTAHTALLIARAAAGDNFFSAKVFDGTGDENAANVTAVIGSPEDAAAGAAEQSVKDPLLARPSWRVHLAFFPADSTGDEPNFELDMRLRDNGVAGDMMLDYGDYAIKATLEQIEALPRPKC